MLRVLAVALCLAAPALTSSAQAQTSECLFCDFDASERVDLADLDLFTGCLTGPSVGPPGAGCEIMDLDADNDVDQDDFAAFQLCYGRSAIAVPPVISEFMSSNQDGLKDQFNERPDWIEIHNPGTLPVQLEGWCLTDSRNTPDKWRFPDVTLPPGGYRVVFASGRDLTDPAQPLHTNFKLEANGEYLALVAPDLASVAHSYSSRPQVADVSFGLGMTSSAVALVAPGADCKALIPSGDIGLDWTDSPYSEAGWTAGRTGVGYEASPGDAVNYTSLIGTNVIAMRNMRETVYIRIPFLVDNPGDFDRLMLRLKYDDGFLVYINGQLVAAENDPDPLRWDSGASALHDDSAAVNYVDYDISDHLGALRQGANVLAIRGLNRGSGSSDLIIMPELTASSSGELIQPPFERYFVTPTPGAPNAGGSAGLGPLILDPAHSPAVPDDHEDLLVTARLMETFNPIASVQLSYRVMFDSVFNVSMYDDGAHGDGAAGDQVYGAVIPASASAPGQMLRYFFTATDAAGNASRWPIFEDPAGSAEYFGTVTANPNVSSQLPILQWFVQNPSAANTFSGTRCSVFFNGEFYDNLFVRNRGQSSSGWPKHNHKFDFNPGDHFRFQPDQPRVEEFNLNSTYSDKSYIRQVLSSETYRDAGGAYGIAFPLRVQQNGAFYSVAVFVEQPDEDYLERNGLDGRGALYKMFNQLNTTSGIEKKTRRNENNSDMAALVNGINNLTGDDRKRYLFDNIDIPACINYIAATAVMHDNDHVHKNYYTYRDSDDTGEWRFLPWDKDLTFGRNYGAGGGVLSDGIWAATDPYSHPLFGDSAHPKVDGPWNRLIDALHNTPEIREMYLRHLRSLMDALLQPPGTPAAQLKYEQRIDELVGQMQSDVALDRARWGNPYGEYQEFATAIAIMKTQYLAPRRTHLYNTHGPAGSGLIPSAQPSDAVIQFGVIEHSPPSGIQDEEYVQLYNPNTYAVDISGWTLEVDGEVKHRFHAGTVIRAQNSLYATPRASAFRARTTSPRGNEMLLVQGNYDKHIAPGERVSLRNLAGIAVAEVTIP